MPCAAAHNMEYRHPVSLEPLQAKCIHLCRALNQAAVKKILKANQELCVCQLGKGSGLVVELVFCMKMVIITPTMGLWLAHRHAGVWLDTGGVRSSTIGRWLDYREGASESILDSGLWSSRPHHRKGCLSPSQTILVGPDHPPQISKLWRSFPPPAGRLSRNLKPTAIRGNIIVGGGGIMSLPAKENVRKKKPQINKSEGYTDLDDLKLVLTKQLTYSSPYHQQSGNKPRKLQVQLPKYNKEQFLLASCQFVISDTSTSLLDIRTTDQMIDWSLVEELRIGIYTNENVVCPICLYPPVAAKITRCGHVFCWPCILHYLALVEKTWIKCPICYEQVRREDLKTAVYTSLTTVKVGGNLGLCLMRRHRYSNLIEPPSSWKPGEETTDLAEGTRYQKILVVGREAILDIVDRETVELCHLLEKEKDTPEACFIESALELAREKQARIMSEENAAASALQPNSQHSSEEYNYFYQAQDGQYIYLHWLNVRMLLHQYGSWETSPAQIAGRVVELEHHSMTKELRNQLRYLKHLPLSTCFTVAELQLDHSLLSPETLELFQKDIKNRKQQRAKKAKNQKREEKEIEKRCRNLPGTSAIRNSSHSPPPTLQPFEFPSLLQEEPAAISSEQALNFAERLKSSSSSVAPALDDPPPPTPPKLEDFPSLAPASSVQYTQAAATSSSAISFSQILKTRTAAAPNIVNQWRGEAASANQDGGEYTPGSITLADCLIQVQNDKKKKNKKKS
ncbi:RNF10 [Cordylochernes scorpioides]|uniref:E3 ubiquitin-protein ligase RNF10 n=1 Tax=Cordylochernes scorpioides TaxID=51811 RepID=A0ABY6JY91_9ARAC|nr:RNF10 [Cordylochernes scorpioides]